MLKNLQYALKNNELIHIDNVDRGIDCCCICPSCGSQLIAKKGKIKIHHFAHFNSEDCNKGIESAYHRMTKEILAEELMIKLPAVYVYFSTEGEFHTGKSPEKLYDEAIYHFDKVYLERRVDDIIPDIILEKNDSKLFIEVYVTHDIDEIKKKKVQSIGISTLRVDLSNLNSMHSREELKNIIVNEVENKKWVFNKKAWLVYKRFEAKARPFESSIKGSGVFCPQYLYGWKGVSSARHIDCYGCEYLFSLYGNANCLGYSGVVTIEDLDNPDLEERAKKLRIENKIQPSWFEGSQCKKCKNGYMQIKISTKGKFLGCSNFPNCKNTINI